MTKLRNKKRTIALLITAVLATMSLTLFAAPTTKTNIFVNGQLKATGFIENDRTFIPLRAVSEALGATVDWVNATKTVIITKGDTTITQKIGQSSATVNGKKIDAGSPAQIKASVTYVPLRFVSETLGANVMWDSVSRSVKITADGVPNTDAKPKEYYEEQVRNAKPFSAFPMKSVTTYTTMDKVPIGNVKGVDGTSFLEFSVIEPSQLPLRFDELNAILDIDTEILDGRKVLVLTKETGNREALNGVIYATQKYGFLARIGTQIPSATETLAELNVGGQRTFIVKQKYYMPNEQIYDVTSKDVEGIVFGNITNRNAIMVKFRP